MVGLGAFGADVVARLRAAGVGGEERSQPFLTIAAEDADPAGCARRIVGACEPLLGLSAALGRESSDGRRPALDVFVVASLGEEAAAKALPALVEAAGRALLGRFSNIFPGHDAPNLGICPVVALLGLRDGESTAPRAAAALVELEGVARAMAFRSGAGSPVARVFAVEQQSSRYELRPSELVSTVVGFLSLVLGTDLRDREPLRSFLRSSVDHARDGRIFASFGTATLEMAIEGACVPSVAAEVAEALRSPDGAADDVDVRAERLVPEIDALVSGIEAPSSGEELVARIRAELPRIDFPSIEPRHEPEHIRGVLYGKSFFDGLQARVAASVERIDGRTMDDLARIADERGLGQVRRLVGGALRAIDAAERSDPRGWMVALRLAESVAARAQGRADALSKDLRDEALPPFPETGPVEAALGALREEADFRPRPARHAFFTALGALAGAALLHPVPKLVAVVLGRRKAPPSTYEGWEAEATTAGFLLEPPFSIALVALVLAGVLHVLLARWRERRERALLAARDDLVAAVRRYVEDAAAASIERYYATRLRFASRAWALRTLRRLASAAARRAQRLARIGAGLDRMLRDLAAEAKRAAGGGEGDGDLVYQRRIDEAALAALREASRPPGGVTERVLERLAVDPPPGDVPSFLFVDRLRDAVAPEAAPDQAALAEALGPAVVDFVDRRQAKIGVPLEIDLEGAGATEQRWLFAPAWAMPPLEAAAERWPLLPRAELHSDGERVHLLTVHTGLARGAIALLGLGGAASRPPERAR